MTFYVVFAVFVVAILVIGFLAVRWAIGRDRLARAASDRDRSRNAAAHVKDGPAGS